MLELKIKMNKTAIKTNEAFGVSMDRVAEIYRKLIAIAKLYPRYSVISESFLNCSDRFTEMERLYGLYALGKVKGAAMILKQLNIKLKCDRDKILPEIELLSLLSKDMVVEDKLLGDLIKDM